MKPPYENEGSNLDNLADFLAGTDAKIEAVGAVSKPVTVRLSYAQGLQLEAIARHSQRTNSGLARLILEASIEELYLRLKYRGVKLDLNIPMVDGKPSFVGVEEEPLGEIR